MVAEYLTLAIWGIILKKISEINSKASFYALSFSQLPECVTAHVSDPQVRVCTQKDIYSHLMVLEPCKPSSHLSATPIHLQLKAPHIYQSFCLTLQVSHEKENPSQKTAVVETDFKQGFLQTCTWTLKGNDTQLPQPLTTSLCSWMKISCWEKNEHLTEKPDKLEMMLTFEQKTNPKSFKFHVHKRPHLLLDNLVTLSNITWS